MIAILPQHRFKINKLKINKDSNNFVNDHNSKDFAF